LPSSDQPAIERQCEREGDDQADSKAAPEERVAEARVDRAGDEQDERVVDDLHYRDRRRIGRKRNGKRAAERNAGSKHRADRERIAE